MRKRVFLILAVLLAVIAALSLGGCATYEEYEEESYVPEAPKWPHPDDLEKDVDLTVTLSWYDSDDLYGLYYDVYLSEDKSKVDNLDKTAKIADDITKDEYTVENLKPNTTYYWRVTARYQDGTEESKSPVWRFTTKDAKAPVISNPNPTDGAKDVSINVTLSWQATDEDEIWGLKFTLYFSKDKAKVESKDAEALKAKDFGDSQYTLTGLEKNTTYYWKVVAKDSDGLEGESPVWSFTTSAVTPPNMPSNPSPADGETDVQLTDVKLSWTGGDPEGQKVVYDLYFSKDENAVKSKDATAKLAGDLDASEYTLGTKLEANTTYYWRVIAKDEEGAVTEGPVWSFTTGDDNSASIHDPYPADGAKDVPTYLTLSWQVDAPEGATLKYTIYLSTSKTDVEDMKDDAIIKENLYKTSYELEDPLEKGTTYYWRVVAEDTTHDVTTKGPVWSFTTALVNKPYTPSNPFPADGATRIPPNSITLSWTGGDPEGQKVVYTVYLSTDKTEVENKEDSAKIAEDIENTYYVVTDLSSSTTYYWRVVAKDTENAVSEGPVWSFTTSSGEVEYVMVGSYDIAVYDVRNPGQNKLLTKVSLNGNDIKIRDTYLYVASTDDDIFKIVDISDPENPTVVGTVGSINGNDVEISSDGNYAFVCDDYNDKFYVIDITDKQNPTLVKTLNKAGGLDIFLSGSYAYLIGNGFRIIDISNPTSPQVVAELSDIAGWSIFVKDDYAYMVSSSYGLTIVDISDKSNPEIKSQKTDYDYRGYDIWVVGDNAYVVYDDDLKIISVKYKSSPNLLKTYSIPDDSKFIYIDEDKNIAYIAGEYSVFSMYDISDIDDVKSLGYFYYSGNEVAFMDDIAFMINSRYGYLAAVDLSELKNRLMWADDSGANAIALKGNYAFVVSNSYFKVIDISDPENPQFVTSIDYGGNDIAISGSYAFVVSDSYFKVIDISDPENPQYINSISRLDESIAISGNYAFVVDGDYYNNLEIFDISDPKNPQFVTSIKYDGGNDIAISGSYAFVVSNDYFKVIDISDPENPQFVTRIDAGGYYVYISGDYAYVGGSGGFKIVDISDPEHPILVHTENTGANAIFVEGNKAYVTSGHLIKIYDISDKENPELLEIIWHPDYISSAIVGF